MKHNLLAGFSALTLALGCSSVAQAAIDHTWVSSTGTNAGSCLRSAPCATLQYAHDNTNTGGVISVLDSGEYAGIVITKSIIIKAAAGVDATISPPNTQLGLVAIQAGNSDIVVVDGLTIDGGSTGVTTNRRGVDLDSGAAVYVINCTIRNTERAVYNRSSNNSASRAFVQRSNLLRNKFGVVAFANSTGLETYHPVISVLDSLIDGSSSSAVFADINTIIGVARTVINAGPVAITTLGNGLAVTVGPSNVVSGTGAFNMTVPFN